MWLENNAINYEKIEKLYNNALAFVIVINKKGKIKFIHGYNLQTKITKTQYQKIAKKIIQNL